MVESGANLNKPDPSTNQTPLLASVQKGHERCLKFLLEKGAHVNLICNDYYSPGSPLQILMARIDIDDFWRHGEEEDEDDDVVLLRNQTKQMRILDLLLQNDADPNIISTKKLPPLAHAAMIKNGLAHVIVEKLIKQGANINCSQTRHLENGQVHVLFNAMYNAVMSYNSDVVRMLIYHGSNTNISIWDTHNKPRSLVGIALDGEDYRSAKFLLLAGYQIKSIFRLKIDTASLKYLTTQSTKQTGTATAEPDHVWCRTLNSDSDINTVELSHTVSNTGIKNINPMLNANSMDALLWLTHYIHQPQSLKLKCRTFLRQTFNMYDSIQLEHIPLPRLLKEYILCHEFHMSYDL